jgi:REP element-mobilizing transposase RayT
MPDHLHLLVVPGSRDIIAFVDGFKTWTTRQAWAAGTDGAIWQPGMWDRTVRGEDDFEAVADYIVRNPVNAGLCESENDWPYTWVWWRSDRAD